MFDAALAVDDILLGQRLFHGSPVALDRPSGFDEALGAGQADKTLFLLRVFDVGIPIVTSAIALAIIATYTITEEKAHEIRTELENRRGKISA